MLKLSRETIRTMAQCVGTGSAVQATYVTLDHCNVTGMCVSTECYTGWCPWPLPYVPKILPDSGRSGDKIVIKNDPISKKIEEEIAEINRKVDVIIEMLKPSPPKKKAKKKASR